MSIEIKNFYLGTPMKEYEYMKIKYDLIPQEIKDKYNIQKLEHKGFIYLEVQKGMYGLNQARVLANKHLEKLLLQDGYVKITHTPGLWTHTSRPIIFTLCVDDFGVKYVRKQHYEHLINTVKETL